MTNSPKFNDPIVLSSMIQNREEWKSFLRHNFPKINHYMNKHHTASSWKDAMTDLCLMVNHPVPLDGDEIKTHLEKVAQHMLKVKDIPGIEEFWLL